MNEKWLILDRSIREDLGRIEKIYEALCEPVLAESTPEEGVIVVAYRIHNLYSAFENVFRNIAKAFENQIEPTGWHRQLLGRMRLDLSPLRPAVVDDAAFEKLDEMLRFRRLFRTGYGVKLDPLRLQIVLAKVLQLRALYRPQIERFLEYVSSLE